MTTTSPGESPFGLAEALSEVARTLQAEAGVEDTLAAITASSVDTVPGADYAGITLVRDRRIVEPVAATGELVVQSDRAQQDLGEGPCLSAIYEQQTVSVVDMRREQRWPRYAARAVELGIGSVLSFQLFADERNLGALNLYSRKPFAFAADDAEHVGLLFASHAAVALRGAQQEHRLGEALRNRDVIGQAKGILIERHAITGEQAFGMLVRTSQTSHVKLSAVAEPLVRTGEEAARHRA